MNNKFIKRVAAVVLGVAVLSTCAFAAPVISGESYTSTLNFSIASNADKVSYIAYASEDGEALGNIVAIGQIDNNVSGGGSFNLPVSSSLLGDAKFIIIKSGDTSGVAAKPKTITLSVADYVAAVTLVNNGKEAITVDGKQFINAPEYTFSVEFNKAGSVTVNKLVANGSHEISGAKLNELASTTFASGAKLNVNFFLAGAPEADIAAGIALEADCTFTAAE